MNCPVELTVKGVPSRLTVRVWLRRLRVGTLSERSRA